MEPEGFLLSIFRFFYRKRKATPLEATKPRFKWLPKYVVPICVPAHVLSSGAPDDEMENILAQLGFEFSYATKEHSYFSRGKSWGDFSIQLIRINLVFDKSLQQASQVRVELADICLFDTGDLWKLSTDVSQLFNGSDHGTSI